MPEKAASELPGLVFDCYRLRDVVDGTPRMVTIVAVVDGEPMIGVSRQSVADKDYPPTGILVAMVKARPRLNARDAAILRHAFLTHDFLDPALYDFPLEAGWDSGRRFDPTHRATVARGVLSRYIWLNGRYQVALAMCDAGRLSREKLHDLSMQYSGELLVALHQEAIARRAVRFLREAFARAWLGAAYIPEPTILAGKPDNSPASKPASDSEPAGVAGDHAKSENLVGEDREPRLTPDA